MVSSPTHLSKWLVLLTSIIRTISEGYADFHKPRGVVKTIKSHENGEIIDCVDIFKQSAFDHPLLKNHTMQMKPISNQMANEAGYVEGAVSQAWWKYGDCPDKTIPIIRPQNHTNRPIRKLSPRVKLLDDGEIEFIPLQGHEYAQAVLLDGFYMGARAKISVWKPAVRDGELSNAQIWLSSGAAEYKNAVHAGWVVDKRNGHTSNEPRIFIYWTRDGYDDTGCRNLECPGFVQTNRKFALGYPIRAASTYDGKQFHINVEIKKNDFTGDWWLRIGLFHVGYWPSEIFTALRGPAEVISWGGEITNGEPEGRHTSTQMGSGHFPSEGFGKVGFFHNLKFIDDMFNERDPKNLLTSITRPECYDLRVNRGVPTTHGVNFYYGGPGYSAQCE